MKGNIISFFGDPVMFLIIGIVIAILVTFIIFGVKADVLLAFFKGFAPR